MAAAIHTAAVAKDPDPTKSLKHLQAKDNTVAKKMLTLSKPMLCDTHLIYRHKSTALRIPMRTTVISNCYSSLVI